MMLVHDDPTPTDLPEAHGQSHRKSFLVAGLATSASDQAVAEAHIIAGGCLQIVDFENARLSEPSEESLPRFLVFLDSPNSTGGGTSNITTPEA
jgi:hypothetical protein